jgi:Glycosyl hydrolases family 16
MYPEKETYGAWPRSGEIDIAQIRGNDPKNYSGGRDTVTSSLHWGVWGYLDQSDRTTGEFVRPRYDLAEGFHTYGLEWTETKLYTWIDDEMYKIEQTGWGPSYGGDMYQRSLGGLDVANMSATGTLYVLSLFILPLKQTDILNPDQSIFGLKPELTILLSTNPSIS